MKGLLTIFAILTSFCFYGQRNRPILKVDLDSTIIFVDLNKYKKSPADSCYGIIVNDTIVIRDLYTQVCGQFLKILLHDMMNKQNVRIMFEGAFIEKYFRTRDYKKDEQDIYNYFDKKTNRHFLRLVVYKRLICVRYLD